MTPGAVLPVLALFGASGAAALVYELVWLQLLQLTLGSSTVSVGVLLGIFMGGMALGSVLAPCLAPQRHPLLVYAALEIGVACVGVLLLLAMPAIERAYAAIGGPGVWGLLARAGFGGICLLPPTIAMGAALPIVARWIEPTRRGDSWVGFLYTANLAGAVIGSLLAGFYLLRVFDMAVATCVAAALNLLVAAGAMLVAIGDPKRVAPYPAHVARPCQGRRIGRVHLVVAISGFVALSAEVIWTRLLTLLFGATVYTLSIVLAIFLIGLGIGSGVGSLVGRRVARPAQALAWCQALAAAAVGWSAWILLAKLPYWPVPAETTRDIWLTYRLDVVRTLLAILPGPLLWGASFPLALRAARAPDGPDAHDDPAYVVGRIYAANTVGAIAGALGTSVWLVGQMGSQHVQQLMIAMSAIAAWIGMEVSPELSAPTYQPARWLGLLRAAGAGALALVCGAVVPPLPGLLVAYGRHSANWAGHAGEMLYVGEGVTASVAVSRTADGVLNYHNAGKIQASSEPQDMRLQRMLGHLTTLVPASPRSVLVIGCGAGVTAGAVSLDPRVERVTIAEIEPLVPQAAAQYFGKVNANVIRNPKVRVQVDDARHYLLTTSERFDAITSDPLDPWVKGAATLYTREFFELARAHLKPGGVMTLFVQLYESSPETVRSELATFFEVFPAGTIWGNTYQGTTADTVLVGPTAPVEIDIDQIEWQLQQPGFADVKRSLGEIGIFSGVELFGNYGGRASELAGWLHGAAINRDVNLRLQYLAGLGVNMHTGSEIYAAMLKYRTFPEDLFRGSPSTVSWLRELIEGPRE